MRPGRLSLGTALLIIGVAIVASPPASLGKVKRKPAPVVPPDLRILAVGLSAEPFLLEAGPLEFTIDVELPDDLEGATLLEVSSLITSPSKRSMRFLANRVPLGDQLRQLPPISDPAQVGQAKPRVAVTLTWDGTDQSKQPVDSGRYQYEVRAKLLSMGDKGPRTQMVSWPKRGTITVKNSHE